MSTEIEPQTIVFDLDGTLVDTLPDLDAAFVQALEGCGWVAPSSAQRAASINLGLAGMVAAARGLQPQAGGSDADLLAAFEQAYARRLFVTSRVYPEVPETLAALRARGLRLAVCTNKSEALSHELLAQAGLQPFFEAVVGGDTTAQPKPSPLPLRAAIAACGGSDARAVLVGDSEIDARCAANAGVPAVLLSHGYASEPELYRSHPLVYAGFAPLREGLLGALGSGAAAVLPQA